MRKNIIKKAALLYLLLFVLPSCSPQPRYPAPPRSGNDVMIDIAALRPEVPEFYTYRHRTKNINFFVIAVDKKVFSFLDACVSCYPKRLGYRYDKGYVVCRACDVSYSVYKLEKGIGGCYPIRIAGRVEKGRYLIPLSTLEGMADKF
jgi:uncharacterized membrane protein